jgi:hypothetical protein
VTWRTPSRNGRETSVMGLAPLRHMPLPRRAPRAAMVLWPSGRENPRASIPTSPRDPVGLVDAAHGLEDSLYDHHWSYDQRREEDADARTRRPKAAAERCVPASSERPAAVLSDRRATTPSVADRARRGSQRSAPSRPGPEAPRPRGATHAKAKRTNGASSRKAPPVRDSRSAAEDARGVLRPGARRRGCAYGGLSLASQLQGIELHWFRQSLRLRRLPSNVCGAAASDLVARHGLRCAAVGGQLPSRIVRLSDSIVPMLIGVLGLGLRVSPAPGISARDPNFALVVIAHPPRVPTVFLGCKGADSVNADGVGKPAQARHA